MDSYPNFTMTDEEIEKGVSVAIKQWGALRQRIDRGYELTPGAVNALTQIIKNIADDPSSFWREGMDHDAAQHYGITLIPNLLNDLAFVRYRIAPQRPISSWEIWHDISPALNRWCFIPKDI